MIEFTIAEHFPEDQKLIGLVETNISDFIPAGMVDVVAGHRTKDFHQILRRLRGYSPERQTEFYRQLFENSYLKVINPSKSENIPNFEGIARMMTTVNMIPVNKELLTDAEVGNYVKVCLKACNYSLDQENPQIKYVDGEDIHDLSFRLDELEQQFGGRYFSVIFGKEMLAERRVAATYFETNFVAGLHDPGYYLLPTAIAVVDELSFLERNFKYPHSVVEYIPTATALFFLMHQLTRAIAWEAASNLMPEAGYPYGNPFAIFANVTRAGLYPIGLIRNGFYFSRTPLLGKLKSS